LFTFVCASRGHLCICTALLFSGHFSRTAIRFLWPGGVTGQRVGLGDSSRGFDSRQLRFQVTTKQYNLVGPTGQRAVIVYGWEGYRRSGIALVYPHTGLTPKGKSLASHLHFSWSMALYCPMSIATVYTRRRKSPLNNVIYTGAPAARR